MLRFRDIMWLMVKYYIERNAQDGLAHDEFDNNKNLAHYKKEMLNVLAYLLNAASNYKNISNSALHYKDEEDQK